MLDGGEQQVGLLLPLGAPGQEPEDVRVVNNAPRHLGSVRKSARSHNTIAAMTISDR
jgi:hypothetical protein